MAASTSTTPCPIAMIAAWPVLRTDSDTCDWIEAPAYFSIETSKRRVSCFSLLKYLTVSKFSSESTALVLASVSDWFISRRKAMRQRVMAKVNQVEATIQQRRQRHPDVEYIEQHAATDQHQEDGGERC